jgi:PAS domain-containing protein
MQQRRILEYGVSVLLVALAATLTVLSDQLISTQTLLVILGSVVLATLFGGERPGLLALTLAAIATAFVMVDPQAAMAVGDVLRWGLFVVVGLLLVRITSDRRQAIRRLRESDARLRLVLEVAHTGIWDYERRSGEVWISPGLERMLGLQEGQSITYEQFLSFVHPDDLDLLKQAVERTFADRVDYEIDFRVILDDDTTRTLAMRGRTYTALSGAQRLVGVVTDRTPFLTLAARPAIRSSNERVAAQA